MLSRDAFRPIAYEQEYQIDYHQQQVQGMMMIE